MIEVNSWQDDLTYIRGGGRVIEARRLPLPEGWELRWQAGNIELPFDPFPSERMAVRAAKEVLTDLMEVDEDAA